MRSPSPVWSFAWRTAAWLVPCFGVWYLVAPWHARVAGWLGALLIDVYKAGIVTSLEHGDRLLTFVTTIKVHPEPGRTALLLPEVNPLMYTYGIALFLALMLASHARWWKVLAGAVALLPFQAWGIAFDLLAQVGVRMTPEIAAQAGLFGWRREFATLGYQLGSLIMPTLAPVMLWAALQARFIAVLSAHQTAPPGNP